MQRHYFANKGRSCQSYGFSSSQVWVWVLDYKESWAPKNWCFWIVVLEKTLGSPLDCKEVHPVHPEGNQSWIFIGRTDAKVETPILWPTDAKSWLIGKDPDAEGRRRVRQKMRWLEALLTQWTWVWVDSGSWQWTRRPGMLQFWGFKESDMTEWLNWTELIYFHLASLDIFSFIFVFVIYSFLV